MLPITSTTSASTFHSSSVTAHWNPELLDYPPARRDPDSVDVFNINEQESVQIPDPYSWLHQPTTVTKQEGSAAQSEEVEKFIASQENLARSYLQKYSHRDHLQKALKNNMDFSRFSTPRLSPDGYYYFRFNSGLQPHDILYRIKKGEDEKAIEHLDPRQPGCELFIDPNLFSHDGTSAMGNFSFSKSGKYLAYMVSHSGSDLQDIHVRRSDTPHLQTAADGGVKGKDPGREEVVKNVKFSCTDWLKDTGFFYSKYPDVEYGGEGGFQNGIETKAHWNQRLYFHKLGDPQSNDILIAGESDDPSYRWHAEVTDDDKYLIVCIRKDSGSSNMIWVADLISQTPSKKMKWNKIVNEFGNEYIFHANDDSRLYFTTTKDAPRGQMVIFDLNKPEDKFQILVPEHPEAVLQNCHVTNRDFAVLSYLKDVTNQLHLYDLKNVEYIQQIGEDLIGTMGHFTGNPNDKDFFFALKTFFNPATVYRYRFDLPEGQRLSEYRRTVLSGLNPDDFHSEQVFFQSKDGTQVPMFLVHRKDFKKDGTAPALQFAYGGFAHSMTPFFSPSYMTFVAQYGGVLAVPNIRGGGEYGEAWHLAGSLHQKQNSFDDFQYATRYLIANKYSSFDKVAITGGSNGGILVAACVNQAPDLFGAAVAEMGVFDMLRYERYTVGHSWISEFGDPKNPEAFNYLKKYSPLHNINPDAKYPALMLMTADHDDRVVPSHSFKFVAELQYTLPKNPNPLLLTMQRKTGHGSGRNTDMIINSEVNRLSFIARSLKLQWKPHDTSV